MGAEESAGEHEIYQRFLAGDEAALAAIYERFCGDLYRFALRMSGSRSVADDVTQEVFLALVEAPARYDPARGALAHFLYGIARHKLAKHRSKARPYVVLEEEAEESGNAVLERLPPDALSELIRRERAALVWKALLALPAHYREVVVLCELQHLSYGEAAEVLGCAVGTVRSRLHRARELLAGKVRSLDAKGRTAPRGRRE